ncbi:hypothetical protein RAM_00440 [Amycolatopsis mediterranei S699]|uniref:Uncharacterized protein n=1 Tax=Amycolatopsis mediterranei (strain S699) TaxID=713604 RepID=A0A9R0NQ54_AMYMS|nr:hypothetical protein RAM_00440 [Amycolatopsis mediterranei S699]
MVAEDRFALLGGAGETVLGRGECRRGSDGAIGRPRLACQGVRP